MTDLFDDVEVHPKYGLNERGTRYNFPPPPGVPEPQPSIGWMRATNLVGAFSDQRALQLWLERMTLLGLMANEGTIFDEMFAAGIQRMEDAEQRAALRKYAELARNAMAADTAARRGTARHTMLEEYLTGGHRIGHRRMLQQLDSLIEVLDAHDLEFIPGWSERYVWHPAGGGTCGRLDGRVMCRRTGGTAILDLKTQKNFWTYQEIAGQQALYNDAPWVWEGPLSDEGQWVPSEQQLSSLDHVFRSVPLRGRPDGPCPGRRVALLAHMVQEPGPDQLPVTLHEVDVEYGARVVELAAQVVELRSIGKATSAERRIGGIRPL